MRPKACASRALHQKVTAQNHLLQNNQMGKLTNLTIQQEGITGFMAEVAARLRVELATPHLLQDSDLTGKYRKCVVQESFNPIQSFNV